MMTGWCSTTKNDEHVRMLLLSRYDVYHVHHQCLLTSTIQKAQLRPMLPAVLLLRGK